MGSLSEEAKRQLEEFLDERRKRSRHTIIAFAVANIVLFVTIMYQTYTKVVEMVSNEAGAKVMTMAQEQNKRYEEAIKGSYTMAVSQIEKSLTSSTDKFHEAFVELGKYEREAIILRDEIKEIRDALDGHRASADSLSNEVTQQLTDSRTALAEARERASTLFDRVEEKEAEVRAVAEQITALKNEATQLDEATIEEGFRKLAAFLELLDQNPGAGDILELRSSLKQLERMVDVSKSRLTCRELIVEDAKGRPRLVASMGEAVKDAAQSAGEAFLDQLAIPQINPAPSMQFLNSEGKCAVKLGCNASDAGAVALNGSDAKQLTYFGASRSGSGLMKLADAEGTMKLALWAGDDSGILQSYNNAGKLLVSITDTNKGVAGQVNTYSRGFRVNSLSTGDDRKGGGLWIYREGIEKHVATLQESTNGGVMYVRDPRTGKWRSLSPPQ